MARPSIEPVDDRGTVWTAKQPRRIVCLVPSLTEAIAHTHPELLVGATDWCTHPSDLEVTRVGGTKWPDLEAIGELRPDLVVANAEENRDEDLAALRNNGIPVWVTAPATVNQAIDSLARLLVTITGDEPDWLRGCRELWAEPVAREPRDRAVIAIWRRPWMVLGRDTFAGDLLRGLGVDNLFADHSERYPRIEPGDERLIGSDLVVLPDEPYDFHPGDGPDAFPGKRIAFVSGRHLTWYGPSLLEAPDILTRQLSEASVVNADRAADQL